MRINGMKVIDAKQPLRIHITATDIKNGKIKSPGNCAAAQSILREVPGCTEARVHLARAYVKSAKSWVRYETPESLRSEIIAFDRGAKFPPGDHCLSVVSPSGRLGAGRTGADAERKKRDPNAPKRKSPHVVWGVRHHGATGVIRGGK